MYLGDVTLARENQTCLNPQRIDLVDASSPIFLFHPLLFYFPQLKQHYSELLPFTHTLYFINMIYWIRLTTLILVALQTWVTVIRPRLARFWGRPQPVPNPAPREDDLVAEIDNINQTLLRIEQTTQQLRVEMRGIRNEMRTPQS